jgi:hypothetical protein
VKVPALELLDEMRVVKLLGAGIPTVSAIIEDPVTRQVLAM